jgi:hypothetical protein
VQTGWLTRREFLKAAAGTSGLLVSTLDFGRWPVSHAATMNPLGGWSGEPGQARYRIDGLAKVIGQRIYARDFQPIDLPNWPAKYRNWQACRVAFTSWALTSRGAWFDPCRASSSSRSLPTIGVVFTQAAQSIGAA